MLSVIRNLLFYRQNNEIENHVIYTINKDLHPDFKPLGLNGAKSEKVFYYSSYYNFYYTCSKLAKFLPDEYVVIIAHDWLELAMVSIMGLQNPVIQYVHGAYNYYYNLAFKHSPWIDNYIVVSNHIESELKKKLPDRGSDIFYLRFPVQDFKCSIIKNNLILNIVFVGRCEDAKGYPLLPKIEKELERRGVKVNWHIVGEGSKDLVKQSLWNKESNVCFYGVLEQNDIVNILCKSDLFILPSLAEGMPVSVVEAMKAGAIPLVSDLQGGITELVLNEVTGFVVSNNDIFKYADVIEKIYISDDRLKQISFSAKTHILNLFEPLNNTRLIENIYLKNKNIFNKHKVKKYGSTLDQRYIPNFITLGLRICIKSIRSIIYK